MSQGITIKGQAPTGDIIPVKVDADGQVFIANSGGSGLTDTELRATPLEITGTVSTTPPVGAATEGAQADQIDILEEMTHAIQSIAAAKGIVSDLRVTIVGGGVSISSGTVTTVTTLTGITNIGGISANQLIPANQNTTVVLSNINNIGA